MTHDVIVALSVLGVAGQVVAGLLLMLGLLYLNQGVENSGWLSDGPIKGAVVGVPGLKLSRLLSDRNGASTKDQAAAFDRLSNSDGVKSTPTILVGKTGGALRQVSLASPSDAQSIVAALNPALR